MKCPKCGVQNGSDFKFCKDCGESLSLLNDETVGNDTEAYSEQEPVVVSRRVSVEDIIEANIAFRNAISADGDVDEFDTASLDSEDIDGFDDEAAVADDEFVDDLEIKTTSIVSDFARQEDESEDYDDTEDDDDDFFFEDINDEPKEKRKREVVKAAPVNPEDDTEVYKNGKESKLRAATDDDDDEYYDYVNNSKASGIAFIVLISVLVILIASLLSVFVSKNFEGKFSLMLASMFGSSPITYDPILELDSTEENVLITIYAKRGSIVTFEFGEYIHQSIQVVNNSVTFSVPVVLWTVETANTAGHVIITPTVYVQGNESENPEKVIFNTGLNARTNGQLYVTGSAEKPSPQSTPVPDSGIALVLPATKEIVTDDHEVKVSGYVDDVTCNVFLGDTQLQVDKDGNFGGVYNIPDYGQHTVYIIAKKGGTEVSRVSFSVTLTMLPMGITIDNDILRTEVEYLIVTGSTAPGEGLEMEINGVEYENFTHDTETGKFSFRVLTPEVRLYIARITLTSTADQLTSSAAVYLERKPDRGEYTRSARNLDYSYLLKHTTSARTYVIKGKVTDVVYSQPYNLVKLEVGNNKTLLFTYYPNDPVIEVGKTYRIYGYPNGIDDATGLPLIYCWYIYID